MIVLVDPVSSGTALAEAFDEYGTGHLRLYSRALVPADPPGRWMVHDDEDTTVDALAGLGVTHVVAASEFGVALADRLAVRLDVPHNEPRTSAARRDKHLAAGVLAGAGIPAVRSAGVRSLAELDLELAGRHFPVLVKPRDSAGSDGCRVCHDPGEAAAAVGSLLGVRNLMGRDNDEVLVQDYLDGPQYIVNTVGDGGRHLLTDLYRCRIDRSREGAPVYRSIVAPMELSSTDREVLEHTRDCLEALGVRHGAAHSEVRVTADGPRLVEVNSRVMGPCLEPDAYFAALGTTHQHATAERYLRPDRFAARFGRPYRPRRALAMVFLRAHRDGVITGMPGLDELRHLPGLYRISRLPVVGRPVPDRLLTTGASGIAFFVHDDPDVLARSLERLHDLEDAGGLYRVEPTDIGSDAGQVALAGAA